MRRPRGFAAILAATVVLAGAPAGGAVEEWEPTVGGWVRGPVEHVRTVPFEVGTAVGAALHGDRLYVTTWRSFSIYDVSAPEDPRLLSLTPLGAQLINEHPVTNGEILLLMDDQLRTLHVWDVRNELLPSRLGSFETPNPDHIWACLLDCAYAYGSGGSILDLADPSQPALVGDWRLLAGAPTRGHHAIGSVAPGLVLTGSLPQYLLDVSDPLAPRRVAVAEPPTTSAARPFVVLGPAPESLVGHVGWPGEGRSRYALSSLETPFSGPCDDRSGAFVTYDTAGHRGRGELRVADAYRITENGTYPNGLAPVNAVGCSPLGFDPHPRWQRTPLAPVAWFEHGVRLLQVGKGGAISEAGGFIGHGTEAFMTVWRTPEVLYVIDAVRGLDVLRVDASSLP